VIPAAKYPPDAHTPGGKTKDGAVGGVAAVDDAGVVVGDMKGSSRLAVVGNALGERAGERDGHTVVKDKRRGSPLV